MARNGSGVYSPPGASFPAVASTLIESAKFNDVVNDIATALTGSLAADGQTPVTANIPLAGYKLTGVGAATARTDAASLANTQDQTGTYVATVGGTVDAITLTPSPAITAYAAGQRFMFIASGANTGAVTVQVSGLASPKALTKNGSTALAAGDIPSGALVMITYDGTRFQLGLTPVMSAAAILAALLTVDGAGSGLDADLLDGISSAALAEIAQARTISGAWDYTTEPTISGVPVGTEDVLLNSQTGAYGLVLTDRGKFIRITTGGITVPANASVAFPVGSVVTVYNHSASTQTIAITTDTLRLAGTTSTGTRTLAVRGLATLLKIDTTEWVCSGQVS